MSRRKNMNKETPREAVKNVLERMSEGSLWQPKGLGLSYVKSGGQTVILISQENIPTSADARVRMRMLIEELGGQLTRVYVKSLMWNI